MADIKISSNGDFQLIKLSKEGTITQDLVEERELLPLLLKRALTTPKNYLTITELKNGELVFKDREYGNNIYRELSEVLTVNFLSRVKQHTVEALEQAGLNQDIRDIQLNVLESHTVQILITYSNGNNNLINIQI